MSAGFPQTVHSRTSWYTSDGQQWFVWREANDHEVFLRLRTRCDYLLRCSVGAEAFAKALMSDEGLIINLSRAMSKGP